MHSISASIVVFDNDPNQVKRASDCLLESEYLTKLYLVDNSSAGAFAREFSGRERIEYILTGSNLGYGRAHNIALKRSIHEGVPYHIVMNPDVYFSSGTIEKLFEFMEKRHDVGLIMPKVLYPDGSLQYLCKMIPTPMDVFARRFLSFGFFDRIVEKNNDRFELRFTGYDKVMNIPYLSGCFMFLRTCALIDVGLFDERFFMYPEDIDLTRRIHEKYKTLYYPGAEIIHDHARESYHSAKMLWIHTVNMMRYFNKWGWFVDRKRRTYNQRLLEELGYREL